MKTMTKAFCLLTVLSAALPAAAVYSIANGNDSGLPVVITTKGGDSSTVFVNTGAVWSDGLPPHDDADYVAMSNYTQYVKGSCTTEVNGHSFQVGTADYKNTKAPGSLFLYGRSDTTPPGVLLFNNEGLYLVNGSMSIRYYRDTFIGGKVTVLPAAKVALALAPSRPPTHERSVPWVLNRAFAPTVSVPSTLK